jgi:hypothetical protein
MSKGMTDDLSALGMMGDTRIMKDKEATRFIQRALEHQMKEFLPGYDLTALSYLNGFTTGYFINPADLSYVHLWRIMINPVDRITYSDTWKEAALIPIDGYQFPHSVIRLKKDNELREMGFDIPAGRISLDLGDVEWRCLWAIKENLKDHVNSVCFMVDEDCYNKDVAMEVFLAYMRALHDLQECLNDY